MKCRKDSKTRMFVGKFANECLEVRSKAKKIQGSLERHKTGAFVGARRSQPANRGSNIRNAEERSPGVQSAQGRGRRKSEGEHEGKFTIGGETS